MVLRGERFPRERIFSDASNCLHVLLPPPDTHFKFIQTTIDEMTSRGLITLNRSKKGIDSGFAELINGQWEKTDLVPSYKFDVNKALDSNWTDISGYSQDWDFPTENSEKLLYRVIKTSSVDSEIVLDFFLGSGTTTAVAHKLNRKWLGVEMGQQFYSRVLPRMKEVLAGKGNHEPRGISKEVKWQGGGFFKYYELEQYEDTLRKVKYEDSDIFDSLSQDPYSQYVFMRDLKMLEALEIDYENNKVKVDLQRLYPNIDVPETLSNLLGKYIKKITDHEVEFENGERLDIANLDYKLIKPLIWW
jgi:adenine-specific DNA-methyltransferase